MPLGATDEGRKVSLGSFVTDPSPFDTFTYSWQVLKNGTEFATGNLMKSPFSFKKYGQNGIEVSEIFPNMGKIIDEFCIVRSMISDIPNHGPSVLMMNTGSASATGISTG